jgi:hypothetical protein
MLKYTTINILNEKNKKLERQGNVGNGERETYNEMLIK